MKLAVLTLFSAAAIAATAWSEDLDADDTGKNTPDRDDQTQTATDNDPADIKISADIRKTVVDDGGVIGGTLGLLAGISALAIPGLGAFIAAGPIMDQKRRVFAGRPVNDNKKADDIRDIMRGMVSRTSLRCRRNNLYLQFSSDRALGRTTDRASN